MSYTAIITGGTRGIGLGIAKELAKCGWNLAVCATREENENLQSLNMLRDFGVEVFYAQMNVADEDSRQKAFAKITAKFARIHLLVNNAGIAPKQRLNILETTPDSFRQLMQTNLEGPFFLTQTVANEMIRQKAESPEEPAMIVNISSISATVASTSRGEYCISKAGVSMATKLWAIRLAEYGIYVYEIRPGIISTDMTTAVREKYDQLIADGLVPQARWGLPEDVGKAVRILAQSELAYSTGQVIMVDGGQLLERL